MQTALVLRDDFDILNVDEKIESPGTSRTINDTELMQLCLPDENYSNFEALIIMAPKLL